jgi:RNA polymerase-binding transcription factor DksA
MPTEWSTDSHDTPGRGDGAPSVSPDSDRSFDDDGASRRGSEAPAPASASTTSRTSADVGADGEGEMHRSAVDAVDGLLDEVELALARLDDGTYGRCEECGEAIDDGRLAAQPIIRRCGSCSPDHGIEAESPLGAPAAESGIVDPVGPAFD